MPRGTFTYSLFGEIETIVAQQMMAEGKPITRLPEQYIEAVPQSCRTNKFGMPLRMVVTMPRNILVEFNRRVDDLRV